MSGAFLDAVASAGEAVERLLAADALEPRQAAGEAAARLSARAPDSGVEHG